MLKSPSARVNPRSALILARLVSDRATMRKTELTNRHKRESCVVSSAPAWLAASPLVRS